MGQIKGTENATGDGKNRVKNGMLGKLEANKQATPYVWRKIQISILYNNWLRKTGTLSK